MDILGAAHRIGHDFQGGMAALAPQMGCQAQVLNNKLNPACASHHLTLVEAMRLQQITGRHDVLFAEADLLGYVCIPLKNDQQIDVTRALISVCSEFGDYMREVETSMEDGKISPNEIKRPEKELAEMLSAAVKLQSALANKGARK